MRYIPILSTLLLILLPQVAYAQADRIVGPAESPNGRLSIFKVTVPNAKIITWTLVNPPPDFNPDVPTKEANFYFASGVAGEYRFVVSVTTVSGESDIGQVVMTHVLKNGSPSGQLPTPNTPTVPTVPTIPTTPQPVDLSVWVASTVTTTVTTDPNRSATAKALAGLYRNWIVTGSKVTDGREFAKGQDALNQIVLTQRGVVKQWDGFFRALAEKLASLNLTTTQDHLNIWPNIAAGLER